MPVRLSSSMTSRMPCAAGRCFSAHGRRVLIQNPPAKPLTTEEMDHVYALPYMRTYHPSYEALGGVPAIQEVQFSIIHNRGCFGACNFCALDVPSGTLHSGAQPRERHRGSRKKSPRCPASRAISMMSAVRRRISASLPAKSSDTHGCMPGQAAACSHAACSNTERRPHGLPQPAARSCASCEGIKKVFIRCGICATTICWRTGTMPSSRNWSSYHISGQLKVAPEHMSDNALYVYGQAVVQRLRAVPWSAMHASTRSSACKQYRCAVSDDARTPARRCDDADHARASTCNRIGYDARAGAGLLPHPRHAVHRRCIIPASTLAR